MLQSIFYGVVTALGWGTADFIARFTGRAMGHHAALLGMLGISAVILTFVFIFSDSVLILNYSQLWRIFLTGIGAMIATLLLYWGLARGPVTVVAPIVGAFPAFNLLFALVSGVRLSSQQWLAIFLVMVGVIIIATFARSAQINVHGEHKKINKTIIIALFSSVCFALTVIAAQKSIGIYGELQTVFLARWVGVFGLLIFFFKRQERPVIPIRWWPILGLQGILDGGAYLCLLLGSQGLGEQITVVIGSTFSAVTVILARIFLKENMTLLQWAGVIFIISGVILLSMYE